MPDGNSLFCETVDTKGRKEQSSRLKYKEAHDANTVLVYKQSPRYSHILFFDF